MTLAKRIFDIVAALVAIVVFSPIIIALIIFVRRKLGTPVFFRQHRPGLHGKPFELVKFRTMTDARDPDGELLPDNERLPPFGSFLRASSLDELPELWNVLKGEMSIVGPRPLLMEYLDLYSPTQARRHDVRPGITGWAQINGRNAISWEQKFALDTWYVDNRSMWLDIKIIARTIVKVLRRDGINAEGEATMPRFEGSKEVRNVKNALYGIYRASGCGRGILPLARQALAAHDVPLDRLVFIDDAPVTAQVNGHAVMTFNEFVEANAEMKQTAIAIADSTVREKLADKCASAGIEPWSVRSDQTVVMDEAQIGEGALLSPFVTITSNIRIGRYFHANLYSYVEHDRVIGDFVTFAPAVRCNGNVHIEDHAYIGTGAIIKQGSPEVPLVIGRGAIVGMGAVVTKSVPAGATVIGNPARIRAAHEKA